MRKDLPSLLPVASLAAVLVEPSEPRPEFPADWADADGRPRRMRAAEILRASSAETMSGLKRLPRVGLRGGFVIVRAAFAERGAGPIRWSTGHPDGQVPSGGYHWFPQTSRDDRSGYMTPSRANSHMSLALSLAEEAAAVGEVPVGAIVVGPQGDVLAAARNRTLELRDPTAHAEILAIRAACDAIGSERIGDCDLYVTLEPCAMCAAAISFARIRRLYFGASDPKSGGVEHGGGFFSQPTCHHAPEVYGGIDDVRSAELLKAFFAKRR